ncbi:hypothetical protein DFH08DRAFT_843518 [Mycena albidolilacea]|uniref:Uncharacterized protein n=1 Tax=Mycena albidolilacea TaxID=1033008 RepID=A0AAD7AKU6_9AGAR|nr:hypothetical protein DFH08DRAFT_843518 [Mycena albidolilacea]
MALPLSLRSILGFCFYAKTIPRWTPTRFYSAQAKTGADTPRRNPGPPRHVPSTYNPSLLVSRDYIDLSGRKYIDFGPKSRNKITRGAYYSQRQLATGQVVYRFPTQSTGFFYYSRDRDAAPLEGSIRFRVTSDNAPSSFNRGHDLLLPSRLPWQIALPQLACGKGYDRICDHLLEEKLVTVEQLSQCRAMFRHTKIHSQTVLFRLNQEFPVTFSRQLVLRVVGKVLHRLKWSDVFRDDAIHFPFTGSGFARFEPSTNPEYDGRRVVHLRITKIMNPVSITQKTTLLEPEAGQLLTRPGHGRIKPWAYDIDGKNTAVATALRALWDNSRIP